MVSHVGFVEKSSNFILGVAGTTCAMGILGGLYRQVSPLQAGFDSTSAGIFGGSLYTINSVLVKLTDSISNSCCTKKAKDPKKVKRPTALNQRDIAKSSCGTATSTLGRLTRFGISAAAAYKFTEFVAEKLNAPIQHTYRDAAILSLAAAATVVGASVYANLADKVEERGGPIAIANTAKSAVKESIDNIKEGRATKARHYRNAQILAGKIKGEKFKPDADDYYRTDPDTLIKDSVVLEKEAEIRRAARHKNNATIKFENKARRDAGEKVVNLDQDSDGETRIEGDRRDYATRHKDKQEKQRLRRAEAVKNKRYERNAEKFERARGGEAVSDYEEDSDGEAYIAKGNPVPKKV